MHEKKCLSVVEFSYQFQEFPGDISPPSHRPQSMLLSVQNGTELPPNTATLSRPVIL